MNGRTSTDPSHVFVGLRSRQRGRQQWKRRARCSAISLSGSVSQLQAMKARRLPYRCSTSGIHCCAVVIAWPFRRDAASRASLGQPGAQLHHAHNCSAHTALVSVQSLLKRVLTALSDALQGDERRHGMPLQPGIHATGLTNAPRPGRQGARPRNCMDGLLLYAVQQRQRPPTPGA